MLHPYLRQVSEHHSRLAIEEAKQVADRPDGCRAVRLEDGFFEQCSRFAGTRRLACRRFNGGVEVRATGRDKGTALARLIARQPEDTLVVYIGDDQTDEDAFRLLEGKGVGIKVGDRQSETAAGMIVADCRAVAELLESWLEHSAGDS